MRAKPVGLGRNDALAALCACAVGAFGLWEASDYDFGTLRQIGPAVFPFALSLLLLAAGVGIAIEGLVSEGAGVFAPKPNTVRALVCVLAAPVVFALLVEPLGLAPAVVAAVIVAGLADPSRRVLPLLALAVGLAVVCSAVFVVLLNLNLDIVAW